MSNFGEAVLQMAMEKGEDESSIMCIKNLMSTMGFLRNKRWMHWVFLQLIKKNIHLC